MSLETFRPALTQIDITSLGKKTLEQQLQTLKKVVSNPSLSESYKLKQVDQALHNVNSLLEMIDVQSDTQKKTLLLQQVTQLQQIKKEIFSSPVRSLPSSLHTFLAPVAFFAPEFAQQLHRIFNTIQHFFGNFFAKKPSLLFSSPSPKIIPFSPSVSSPSFESEVLDSSPASLKTTSSLKRSDSVKSSVPIKPSFSSSAPLKTTSSLKRSRSLKSSAPVISSFSSSSVAPLKKTSSLSPASSEKVFLSPHLNNLRAQDNQMFYRYVNTLDMKNIKYGFWVRNSRKGSIDCSWLVCETLSKAKGVAPSIKRLVRDGQTSESLITEINKKNKTMQKSKDLSKMSLKEGMIVSVDTGETSFDRGRKFGIDHTALIVRDPHTQKLMVGESVKKVGVRMISLAQRERNMKNAGKRKGVSTTFFTVDPYVNSIV